MNGAKQETRETASAVESRQDEVPWRELGDWCAAVLRDQAEARAKEKRA